MERFSVLYQLDEEYHHISCLTHEEAKSILQRLTAESNRIPVGIYDAKTELFEWEPIRQRAFNKAGIAEQGKLGDQIITIAEALRRRNPSWASVCDFPRPAFLF